MPAKATWRALTVDAAIDIDSDTYESDRQEYKVQQLLFDQHCPAMTFYWRLNHGETSECAQPHDVNLDKRPLVTAGADSGMYTSTGGTLFFIFFMRYVPSPHAGVTDFGQEPINSHLIFRRHKRLVLPGTYSLLGKKQKLDWYQVQPAPPMKNVALDIATVTA